ncbi:thioesterase-like superfamily-domain-containing protein [Xylaria telfairii]|nr:thioesterase-like superfamily-domain-containing protein [Xylaria telfairii]
MRLPSVEEVKGGLGRLTYQEALSLISLPDRLVDGQIIKRYMSRRSAWIPGAEFALLTKDVRAINANNNAYGGHVYSQAALAASLSLEAAQGAAASQNGQGKELGIHTIHGFFSEGGRSDRPFIYEVKNIASNASFPNLLVTARQPASPSTSPEGDHYPKADADLPLGPVCFSAMVSFRPSSISQFEVQEPSLQERFADILNSRPPMEWDPAPISDIAAALDGIPGARQAVGLFPGIDMRKVDMRAYNKDRPFHERRELILYRLIAPLPTTASEGSSRDGEGRCAIDGQNTHICAHAHAADRNGLLMIGDHAGFGNDFARAASLSYSFVVHVNAEEAAMMYSEGDDQWWAQETCFPRVQAGRGIVHSKIWSPRGVHVASMYQDGIIRRQPRSGDRIKGKL